MGKKRKGGKKREGALSSLKDAVSDEETGILGDDGVNGEAELVLDFTFENIWLDQAWMTSREY